MRLYEARRSRRPVAISGECCGQLARRGRLLSWLSLGVISVEGFVAILAGILAGSVALIGFGWTPSSKA